MDYILHYFVLVFKSYLTVVSLTLTAIMSKLFDVVLRRLSTSIRKDEMSNQTFRKSLLQIAALARLDTARLNVSAFRPVQTKTDVLDVKINYELLGTGSHPLICLPGALGFIEADFGPVLKKISLEKFTVVVWDPPGFGKSRPPDRNMDGGMREMLFRDVPYVDALMKKLGFPKYSILGWSDGAITAMLLASTLPASLRKLVIWGGFTHVREIDVIESKQLQDTSIWSRRIKDPMMQMYGEECFERYWRDINNTFERTYKNNSDICTSDLANIQCPTLVFQGLKDSVILPFHATYIHERIKQSEFHVMKEGKHNLHLQFSDEFLSVSTTFLLKEN